MVNQLNATTPELAKLVRDLDAYQMSYEFKAPNYLKVWSSGPRDPLLALLREDIKNAGLLLIDQHHAAHSEKTINTYWIDEAALARKAE